VPSRQLRHRDNYPAPSKSSCALTSASLSQLHDAPSEYRAETCKPDFLEPCRMRITHSVIRHDKRDVRDGLLTDWIWARLGAGLGPGCSLSHYETSSWGPSSWEREKPRHHHFAFPQETFDGAAVASAPRSQGPLAPPSPSPDSSADYRIQALQSQASYEVIALTWSSSFPQT
jgi:hypothetical protein